MDIINYNNIDDLNINNRGEKPNNFDIKIFKKPFIKSFSVTLFRYYQLKSKDGNYIDISEYNKESFPDKSNEQGRHWHKIEDDSIDKDIFIDINYDKNKFCKPIRFVYAQYVETEVNGKDGGKKRQEWEDGVRFIYKYNRFTSENEEGVYWVFNEKEKDNKSEKKQEIELSIRKQVTVYPYGIIGVGVTLYHNAKLVSERAVIPFMKYGRDTESIGDENGIIYDIWNKELFKVIIEKQTKIKSMDKIFEESIKGTFNEYKDLIKPDKYKAIIEGIENITSFVPSVYTWLLLDNENKKVNHNPVKVVLGSHNRAIAGIVAGLYDYENIDVAEVEDTLMYNYGTGGDIGTMGQASLIKVDFLNDRTEEYDDTGYCPYGYKTYEYLLYQEAIIQILEYGLNKIDENYENLHNYYSNNSIKIKLLKDKVLSIFGKRNSYFDQILYYLQNNAILINKLWNPNICFYQQERNLTRLFLYQRRLSERHEKVLKVTELMKPVMDGYMAIKESLFAGALNSAVIILNTFILVFTIGAFFNDKNSYYSNFLPLAIVCCFNFILLFGIALLVSRPVKKMKAMK